MYRGDKVVGPKVKYVQLRRSFVVTLRYVTDTGGNLCKQKLWLILEQYEESNLSLRAVLV